MLQLKLCGVPEARSGDIVYRRVRSDRVWALLGYLALHGHSWTPRTEVAAVLWPDASDSLARKRLRQTLIYVRDAFEGLEVVQVTDKLLRLSQDVVTDVDAHHPAPNLLETLDDEWIRHLTRDLSIHDFESIEDDKESESLRRDLVGLSRPEVEEYLRGHLPIWLRSGRLNAPLAILEELARDHQLDAVGYLALAEMRIWRGELALGQGWLRRREVQSATDSLLAWRHFLEGMHAHRSGWDAEALRSYQLALRNPKVHPLVSLQSQYLVGYVEPIHQDALQLRRLVADGKQHATRVGDPFRARMFDVFLVIADHRVGDDKAALARLAAFSEYFGTPGRPHQTAPLLYRAGRLYQELGVPDAADRCFAVALEHALMTENPRIHAEALTYVADRKLELEIYGEALLLHLEALAIRREGQAPWAVATSLRGAGVAALRQGLHHQARPLLTEAVTLYEQVGDGFAAASALFALAQVAQARENRERARKYAQATLALLKQYGQLKSTLDVPATYATQKTVEAFLRELSSD